MPDWVAWMIAAGVLAVGEIVSLSFFLGPIAVAAVAAALAALLGAGLAVQIVVFILASAASLLVLRPVAGATCAHPPRSAPAPPRWWASGRGAGAGGRRRRAGQAGAARCGRRAPTTRTR